MKYISVLIGKIRELFYPNRCLLCGRVLPTWSNSGVCSNCDNEDYRLSYDRKITITLNDNSTHTVICKSPFKHIDPIKKRIYSFKFFRVLYLRSSFAVEIYKKLRTELKYIDVITYAPLLKGDRRKRGFDQSYLLAKELRAYTGIPTKSLLLKIKKNRMQHKLSSAERRLNVIGVYATNPKEKITGKNILLIDDIITTGSTLGECCKMLFEGGAKSVLCATISSGVMEEYKCTKI